MKAGLRIRLAQRYEASQSRASYPSVFCGFLYSVLLLNANLGLDFLGLALSGRRCATCTVFAPLRTEPLDSSIVLRVLLDVSVLEVYAMHGRAHISTRAYPDDTAGSTQVGLGWFPTETSPPLGTPACEAALSAACPRPMPAGRCGVCAGVDQHALRPVGCSAGDVQRWCSGGQILPSHAAAQPQVEIRAWEMRPAVDWILKTDDPAWPNAAKSVKTDEDTTPSPLPPVALHLDGHTLGRTFDGHGLLSAGASSRLLCDYKEPQRSQILDYLFKPQFGASLDIIKVEIGGDCQSTSGTEASHMHSRDDLGCGRGYEGFVLTEALRRNPSIKTWGLSWGVPAWISEGSFNSSSYFTKDNIRYQTQWLKCIKETTGITIDYIGIWNGA